MTFTPEQTTLLQAKLDPSHVAERTQAGRKLNYIEGWWAISEANRIFGFDGWHRETVDLQETHRALTTVPGYGGKPDYEQWRVSFIARVRVTVGNIVREGTGYGSGMAKPEALGDAIESAAKEAETDAMKRAMMTFGNPFGLALYDKTQANVGVSADNDRFAAEREAAKAYDNQQSTPNTVTGPAVKSSAALKRDGAWEKLHEELTNDFVDCHSLASLHKLRIIYRQKAVDNGWPKAWLEALKDQFDQQEDALKKSETLLAGE